MKKYYLLVILVLLVNYSFSQGGPGETNSHAILNVVPPSPTASAIAKYGNFPVNMANGVANVSIPIYTLQGDGISLPVSLSYHGGGVKVDEVSSWVGLGWSLNAGGVVSRTIVGTADELNLGYMQTASTIYPYDNTPAAFSVIQSAANGSIDSQPDRFSFNVGGYSGDFFFSSPDDIHLVPQQDLVVEMINPPDGDLFIAAFKIITPDGIEYYFDQREYSSLHQNLISGGPTDCAQFLHGNPNQFAPTSWYLSSVYNPNTKDEITLDYNSYVAQYDLSYSESHTFRNLIITQSGCRSDNDHCVSYLIKTEQGVQLSEITSKYGRINFLEGDTRSDLGSPFIDGIKHQLSEIKIYGAEYNESTEEGFLKEFVLSQSMIESADPFEEAQYFARNRRMYLESIQEIGADGTEKPAYVFGYNNRELLPPRLSLNQDHYGYYNGADNDVFIPPSPYSGFVHGGLINNYTGADRSVQVEYCDYGLLSNITYPTGGNTSFIYEGHLYLSDPIPEVIPFDSGLFTVEPSCENPDDYTCNVESESEIFTLTNPQNVRLYRSLQRPTDGNGGPLDAPQPICELQKSVDGVWIAVDLVGIFDFSPDPPDGALRNLLVSGMNRGASGFPYKPRAWRL